MKAIIGLLLTLLVFNSAQAAMACELNLIKDFENKIDHHTPSLSQKAFRKIHYDNTDIRDFLANSFYQSNESAICNMGGLMYYGDEALRPFGVFEIKFKDSETASTAFTLSQDKYYNVMALRKIPNYYTFYLKGQSLFVFRVEYHMPKITH